MIFYAAIIKIKLAIKINKSLEMRVSRKRLKQKSESLDVFCKYLDRMQYFVYSYSLLVYIMHLTIH
jgi:hypothetical protein